eukprot:s3681_g1.t1
MQLPAASHDPHSFWILALQGIFFLFAIIVVVAYHVILIVLWAAPMTTRMQKQFFLTAQVLNAWSGLDVFCVTILAGVLEIRQFANFIVGNKCDGIDALLAKSPLADQMPGGVITCFDVDSTLRAGYIVLAVAVVISTITGQVMLAKCSHALCAPPESLCMLMQLTRTSWHSSTFSRPALCERTATLKEYPKNSTLTPSGPPRKGSPWYAKPAQCGGERLDNMTREATEAKSSSHWWRREVQDAARQAAKALGRSPPPSDQARSIEEPIALL